MKTVHKLSGWTLARRLMGLALLACLFTSSGCNYFIALGYLIGGPPSVEPDFDKITNKSLTDLEVVVAVVCYAPPEVQWKNSEINWEIAEYVAHRLNQHKIVVCTPAKVRRWIENHPDWDRPEEVGKGIEGVEVTHVVFIDLSKFTLYEEDAPNLYRGRAEAIVSVVAQQPGAGDDWREVYVKELVSRFPLGVPRPISLQSFEAFKKEYLVRLSEEIGRLFYEHYNGDDMADVI